MSTKLLLLVAVAACLATLSTANVEAQDTDLAVIPIIGEEATDLQSLQAFPELLHEEAAKLGLSADVTATLQETLFKKICAAVLPAINEIGKNLVIPGESQKHFRYSTIVVQNFKVAGIAITFAAPNKISVSVTGLTFAIPHTEFHVMAKIVLVKVSCGGKFWASLGPTNIVLTLPVSASGGKLVFGTPTTNVQWGALNIGHKLSNLVCKVGGKIVQLFIGNIDKKMKSMIQNELPKKMGPPIAAALNAALKKLPLVIVSSPAVTANSISLTANLLGGLNLQGTELPLFAGERVAPLLLPARDVVLKIPALATNNILLFVQQRGMFNGNMTNRFFNTSLIQAIFPNLYAQCPGCPFGVEIVFPAAPFVVARPDYVELNLRNAIFSLSVVKPNGAHLQFVDIYVNASLRVNGLTVNSANKVYFQLQLLTHTFVVDHSGVGPFVPTLLTNLVTFMLSSIVIPDFNQKFDGVALSPMMQSAAISVEQSSVFFGFNLALS